MSDLKLHPLLEAIQPEALASELAPFWAEAEGPIEVTGSRVQAPTCCWTTYRRGDRLVTLKCFFSSEAYDAYLEKLRSHYADRLDLHAHPLGGLRLLPALNAIMWAFPFDPRMPRLADCLDPTWIGGWLARRRSARPLRGKLVRYNPEVGAIVAYRAGGRTVAYGKAAADGDGAPAFEIMSRLWERGGPVDFARPLAYVAGAGLLLQAPAPGRIISAARNSEAFLDLVCAAGPALAQVHGSEVASGPQRSLEGELERVRRGLPELALTAPRLYASLRQLLAQIDSRLASSTPAFDAPSHGDYKWNQFLASRGRFSLIDFELFCQAEPYLDLGWFCAYLPPAEPDTWRDGVAVELLRARFLDGYQQAAGWQLDFRRLGLWEAVGLAMRALSHVWQHQAGWRLQASQLLDLAFERLVAPEPELVEWPLAS